jgi:2-oxoglutarate ferredoxin oxidoreductase subunit delta
MAGGEITINEEYCKGCGLCVEFCPSGCIEMSTEKFNNRGVLMPVFSKPEDCTGCTTCGYMCPDAAILVYRFKKDMAAVSEG